MGNAGGHAAYGGKAIAHSDLALQATNLGEVVKGINVAHHGAVGLGEWAHGNAKGLRFSGWSEGPHLSSSDGGADVRQAVAKDLVYGFARQFMRPSAQQPLAGNIQQRDVTVESSGDQAAA